MQCKYIKKEEVFRTNPNSSFGMNQAILRILANGNVQFIINLSRELELGYSVPCLAMQLFHVFFSKKCYINYDRFLILAACILLSLKTKDINIQTKKICNAFYRVIIHLNKSIQAYNQEKFELIRNEICRAESDILRTLEYNSDYKLPLEFVDKYCTELIPDKRKSKVFHISRILILDSYRTFACMMFNPLVVFMACFLIACRYQFVNCYDCPFVRNSPGMELESSQQALYLRMLELISNEQSYPLKAEDVRDCIAELNRLTELVNSHLESGQQLQ